jgi:large subunit ribosomal protein L17e
MAIKGMSLRRAQRYLNDVVNHKDCIPFRRFNGGVGRSTHAKMHPHTAGQGRYPVKSVQFIQNLLKNAEANAEVLGSSFSP